MFGIFASKEQQAERWHQKGIEAFRRRDIEEASKCLWKALEFNPKDVGALHDYGVILGQFGAKYEDAKRFIEEALEIDPNFPTAWKSLAIAEKMLGNTDRAVELFKMVKNKYGWNPNADPAVKDSEREWLEKNGVI